MKIGILETGKLTPELESKYGAYPDMFVRLLQNRGLSLEFEMYAVVDNVFPGMVNECDAWLITGSRHGAYEDFEWISHLEEFIRQSVAQDIPLVGICFGHQIIAQALGGKVVKSEKGWGLGVNDYQVVHSAPWMNGSGNVNISINAVHQDQVVQVPENAQVLASSEFCPNAMLAYGDLIYTIQPHPEFDHEFQADLINARREIVFSSALADEGLASLSRPIQSNQVANWIVAFLNQHV